MCYSCFGSYSNSSLGFTKLEKKADPPTVNCDLELNTVRHLSVVVENQFIKTKDKELIPLIEELRSYVKGFYSKEKDICDSKERIDSLIEQYM